MTVYFVQSQEYVKIGYSSRPATRVRSLQTSSPQIIKVLLFMPGSPATERAFHGIFSPYHCLNEWYRLEGDLLAFVNVASSIFSEYTSQLEANENHREELEMEEYWREKALQATAAPRRWSGSMEEKKALFSSWLERTDDPTPEEFEKEFGASRRTFFAWMNRLDNKPWNVDTRRAAFDAWLEQTDVPTPEEFEKELGFSRHSYFHFMSRKKEQLWSGSNVEKLAMFTDWLERTDDPTPEKFKIEYGASRRTYFYWMSIAKRGRPF